MYSSIHLYRPITNHAQIFPAEFSLKSSQTVLTLTFEAENSFVQCYFHVYNPNLHIGNTCRRRRKKAGWEVMTVLLKSVLKIYQFDRNNLRTA